MGKPLKAVPEGVGWLMPDHPGVWSHSTGDQFLTHPAKQTRATLLHRRYPHSVRRPILSRGGVVSVHRRTIAWTPGKKKTQPGQRSGLLLQGSCDPKTHSKTSHALARASKRRLPYRERVVKTYFCAFEISAAASKWECPFGAPAASSVAGPLPQAGSRNIGPSFSPC